MVHDERTVRLVLDTIYRNEREQVYKGTHPIYLMTHLNERYGMPYSVFMAIVDQMLRIGVLIGVRTASPRQDIYSLEISDKITYEHYQARQEVKTRVISDREEEA